MSERGSPHGASGSFVAGVAMVLGGLMTIFLNLIASVGTQTTLGNWIVLAAVAGILLVVGFALVSVGLRGPTPNGGLPKPA